jgi:hypothetical protein
MRYEGTVGPGIRRQDWAATRLAALGNENAEADVHVRAVRWRFSTRLGRSRPQVPDNGASTVRPSWPFSRSSRHLQSELPNQCRQWSGCAESFRSGDRFDRRSPAADVYPNVGGYSKQRRRSQTKTRTVLITGGHREGYDADENCIRSSARGPLFRGHR